MAVSLYRRVHVRSGHVFYCTRQLFLRSREEKKSRRSEIIRWGEIKKGYFSDLKEYKRTGGKVFQAADHICMKEDATPFPSLSGQTLSGVDMSIPQSLEGSVSLVLLSMRGFGMTMCDLYRHPFTERFGKRSDVLLQEVTVVEGWMYKLMKPILQRNLRKLVSEDRHGQFMCYAGAFDSVKRKLELHNSIIGYAYLLDREGAVRWTAHGKPSEEELNAMALCCQELLSERE